MFGSFTLTHLLYLFTAIGWTLVLSGLAFALGAAGGFAVMLARISPRAWLRWIAIAYIECIQGIPLLILLFIVYFGLSVYGYYNVGSYAFIGGVYTRGSSGQLWRGYLRRSSLAMAG